MHRITPKVARQGAATPSWDDRRVRAANPEPFRNPPGCERRLAAVEGEGTLCVLRGSDESGRPGSNRRRPAWEAGILPLNYAREPRDRSAVAARWQQRAAAAIAPDGSLTAWGPAPTIRRGHGDVAGRLEHD